MLLFWNEDINWFNSVLPSFQNAGRYGKQWRIMWSNLRRTVHALLRYKHCTSNWESAIGNHAFTPIRRVSADRNQAFTLSSMCGQRRGFSICLQCDFRNSKTNSRGGALQNSIAGTKFTKPGPGFFAVLCRWVRISVTIFVNNEMNYRTRTCMSTDTTVYLTSKTRNTYTWIRYSIQ